MFRSRKNWGPIIGFTVIIMLLFGILIIDFRLKASLLQMAKSKVQVSGTEKINQIVKQKIVSQVKYEEIITVHKDGEGKIVMIQPDTIVLNKIMADTISEVANSLGLMQAEFIEIPLGQLSGSNIIAGYGPRFKVKIIPAGEVHVDILNKFEQAGINQTRHLIYFKIDSDIRVAVPMLKDEIKVSAIIPLAETIIVGQVPETYVNFRGQDEMIYPFIDNNFN